jgi:hypothetical protein
VIEMRRRRSGANLDVSQDCVPAGGGNAEKHRLQEFVELRKRAAAQLQEYHARGNQLKHPRRNESLHFAILVNSRKPHRQLDIEESIDATGNVNRGSHVMPFRLHPDSGG